MSGYWAADEDDHFTLVLSCGCIEHWSFLGRGTPEVSLSVLCLKHPEPRWVEVLDAVPGHVNP